MSIHWLFICALSAVALAQSQCTQYTPPSSGRAVLTYTPYVTPQIPPTRTIYNHIVTAWTYAVDCRFVSIKQVDANQAANGPFSGIPKTVDALTITRIGCIQQTSAVTRRDVVRGYPTDVPEATDEIVLEVPETNSILHKRATLKESMMEVATKQADEIPPDAQGLSVRAYRYLVQVNTAIYALNLYNTGFNMSATCTLLNDPITKARLQLASIAPAQAAGIVCYAAQNGLYFNMSNAQLLSNLLGIIYSIEIKSGFTTNTTTICEGLDLDPASSLGVDTSGVHSYVCDEQATSSSSSSSTTIPVSSATNVTGTVWTTNLPGTAVGTGAGGSAFSPTAPYTNSTTTTVITTNISTSQLGTVSVGTISPSSTSRNQSVTTGTRLGTAFSGVGPTAGSATISETFNIIFPNATAGVNTTRWTGTHLPPTPTAFPSYALWTTSTTSGIRLPKY